MELNTRSYNYEKREEMFVRWANVMNCEWLEDEDLKSTVFETIKDENKLPTPLNIEQFAIATAKKILDKEKILEKINAKSIETARSFAEEIKVMSADRILFLLFPFISYRVTFDFVKVNYEDLTKDFEDAWGFDRIINWFKDDKIDITYDSLDKTYVIEFSHPSYSEAIGYAISDIS